MKEFTEDKMLQELLQKVAVEKASPEFTANVIKRVEALNTSNIYNYSLVEKKWEKVYKLTFIAIAAVIILISFLLQLPEIVLPHFVKNLTVTNSFFYTAALYVSSLWLIIFLNATGISLLPKKSSV